MIPPPWGCGDQHPSPITDVFGRPTLSTPVRFDQRMLADMGHFQTTFFQRVHWVVRFWV